MLTVLPNSGFAKMSSAFEKSRTGINFQRKLHRKKYSRHDRTHDGSPCSPKFPI